MPGRRYAIPSVSSDGVLESKRYDDLITYHASANSVRPELVRAVIQTESAFNPRARSSKGAMGLMQLMTFIDGRPVPRYSDSPPTTGPCAGIRATR